MENELLKSTSLQRKILTGFLLVSVVVLGFSAYLSKVFFDFEKNIDQYEAGYLEHANAIQLLLVENTLFGLFEVYFEDNETTVSHDIYEISDDFFSQAEIFLASFDVNESNETYSRIKYLVLNYRDYVREALDLLENGDEDLFHFINGPAHMNLMEQNVILHKYSDESLVSVSSSFEVSKKQIINTQIVLISILLVSIVVILTFIFLSSNYYLEQVNELLSAARSFQRGDLKNRVKVTSKDELGQLAIAFNNMANDMEKLYAALEEEVKVKTKKLNEKIEQERKQNMDLQKSKKAMLNVLEDLEKTKMHLEHEKAQAESILASIGDGILAISEEGQILFVNPVTTSILSVSREEMENKSWVDVFEIVNDKGENIVLQDNPIFKVLQSGEQVSSNKYYLINKKGNLIPVAITISGINLQGRNVGAIVVFRDISKEKEVDRMKTEFISLASHQLRTPLTSIKWFLEVLLSGDAGEVNEEQRGYLGNVLQANERMIGLIEALLKISRLERGRIVMENKRINLRKVLEEILVDFQLRLKTKNMEMDLVLEDNLPEVFVDEKMMQQVFSNLISNAIKYSSEGGKITVRIKRDGQNVCCEVEDQGIGIPVTEKNRVFEKFYRGGNIFVSEVEGNGLGLYLVKMIVEGEGGKISFVSEENKGTTFKFFIPVMKEK